MYIIIIVIIFIAESVLITVMLSQKCHESTLHSESDKCVRSVNIKTEIRRGMSAQLMLKRDPNTNGLSSYLKVISEDAV